MQKKHLKLCSAVLAAFMLTSLLGACKKNESDPASSSGKSNTSTAKASASPAKTSSTASSSKQTTTSNGSTQTQGTTASEGGSQGQGGQGGSGGLEALAEPGGGAVSPDGTGPVVDIQEVSLDLKGRTFTIICQNAFRYVEPKEDGDVRQVAYYKALKRAEQKYNFKAEWILRAISTTEFANEFVNSAMAGIKYADIIGMSTKQAMPALVEQGYLAPLDQYLDFQSDPLFNANYVQKTAFWRGKHYGFYEPRATGSYGMLFNRDLFEAQGIANPQEISEAGNWTWDTFLSTAQEFTKDFNGDGINDQWGAGTGSTASIGESFVYSNGCFLYREETTRLAFALNDPKAIKALQFVSDLTNVYKVVSTDTKAKNFETGIAAIGIGYKSYPTTLPFRMGFVVMPKGPDTAEENNISECPNFFGVPQSPGVNVMESAAVMREALTIWDTNKPDSFNVDEYLYNTISQKFSDPRDIQYMMQHCTNPNVTYAASFPDLQKLVNDNVYNKIVTMEQTPATALETVEGTAQGILDNAIKH